MKGKIYLIENQDNKVTWFVFCFKMKLCAKMMFSLLLMLQMFKKFVLGCTERLCQMGLIVITMKLFSLVLGQPILIGWD